MKSKKEIHIKKKVVDQNTNKRQRFTKKRKLQGQQRYRIKNIQNAENPQSHHLIKDQ